MSRSAAFGRLLLLVTAALALPALAQEKTKEPALEKEVPLGRYTLRLYRTADPAADFPARAEILKDGETVWSEGSGEFYIGAVRQDPARTALIPLGKDPTGRARPSLILSSWTGGAHCCYDFFVFELGEEFRLIGKLEAGDDALSYFYDVDGDERMEFVSSDGAFAYFGGCFSCAPLPRVILRYKGGKYRLAGDLLRRLAPATGTMAERAARAKALSWEPGPPRAFWDDLFALAYAGYLSEARRWVLLTWPKDLQGGAEAAWTRFEKRLRESPYWPEIEELSKTPPETGEPAPLEFPDFDAHPPGK